MLKYTIGFIRRGDEILMLNRHKSPLMGVWTGVGGKLEDGETPEQCIIRETFEETGIQLKKVMDKGIVTWGKAKDAGMYAFIADVSNDFIFETPVRKSEGILDWKTLDWLIHPENRGVAAHVKRFLPILIHDPNRYEFQCVFNDNGTLRECNPIPIEKVTI